MRHPGTQVGPAHLATFAALAALLVGVATYLTLRSGDTLVFTTGLGLAAPAALAGSLPAMLHTFAFVLLSAVCLGLERRAAAWCAGGWALVGTTFEVLQHDLVATALLPHPATLLPSGGVDAGVALLARYAHLGVFDPLDIAATLLGAFAAWLYATALLARRSRATEVRP